VCSSCVHFVWTLKFLHAVLCISLICAVPAGHVEVVRLLLSRGVPVDPIERRGTPLHLAAVTDNHQALKLLLDHGADVSCRVSLGCYPVALAIRHTIH
jgi:ankyrin repeat protein